MFFARSIDRLIVKRLTIKQGHALCPLSSTVEKRIRRIFLSEFAFI